MKHKGEIKWSAEPEDHDYPAAGAYLVSLAMVENDQIYQSLKAPAPQIELGTRRRSPPWRARSGGVLVLRGRRS